MPDEDTQPPAPPTRGAQPRGAAVVNDDDLTDGERRRGGTDVKRSPKRS